MNKIRLNIFLIVTLFMIQFIVSHGLAPIPVFWYVLLLSEKSIMSLVMNLVFLTVLVVVTKAIVTGRLSNLVQKLIVVFSFIFVLLNLLFQYNTSQNYVFVSVLSAIPYFIAVLLILYDFKKR